jgi:glycosyltransferase involved in cell wall biosynthesis
LAPFVAVGGAEAPLGGMPPVMIAIGMMRPGAKLASYRRLAQALEPLLTRPWRLAIVGDGPARGEVAAALAPVAERIDWRGALPPEAVTRALLAADLCVWPAIGEALGLALLEAQAVGVPVVAGNRGGVACHIREGQTGLLVSGDDPADFTRAVAGLLADPARRRIMGSAARAHVTEAHSLDSAARRLTEILEAIPRCGS